MNEGVLEEALSQCTGPFWENTEASLDGGSSVGRWEEVNRLGISTAALTGLVDRLDGVGVENGSKAFFGATGWLVVLLSV